MKPECRIDKHGTKRWYLNGKLHREYEPAMEWVDGTKHWYLNRRRHRKDGPAVERYDGTKEWWAHDELISKEDFTSIEMVVHFKAFELFTPKELLRLRLDNNTVF